MFLHQMLCYLFEFRQKSTGNFWRVYLKRFCIESVHQFAKNSLVWMRARLGHTDREERWSWLVMLAYWQLLLAAPIAKDRYRPWQKPMPPRRWPTPARVQRDYFRIFIEIGTPAQTPKLRGIPRAALKAFVPCLVLAFPSSLSPVLPPNHAFFPFSWLSPLSFLVVGPSVLSILETLGWSPYDE